MKCLFEFKHLFLTILLLPSVVFLKTVDRVNIFDSSDNHIMFIVFDYDDNGNNISRTIFMSDSTFVRRDVLSGNKAYSLNFNGDTVLTSNYSEGESGNNLSVHDQFGNDMLGGTVDYNENSSDEFVFSQNNSLLNTFSYDKDADGDYSRISITNPSGQLQYYATLDYTGQSGTILPPKDRIFSPFLSVNNNRIELRFSLSEPSIIDCELISLSGRRVAKLISKKVPAGSGHEIISIDKQKTALSSGVYFITFSVDGKRIFNRKVLRGF